MRVFRLDDQNPLTGWHMLGIVLSFFGVVIAVNIVMAIAATGTFPGLVVANSYVASQHYDELLARAREQEAAGWRHDLGEQDGVLHFSLSQGPSQMVRGLAVSAHVGRPSTTLDDRRVAFVGEGGDSYVATSALSPGLWEVDLEARSGGELLFRRTEEIFVRPAEPRP